MKKSFVSVLLVMSCILSLLGCSSKESSVETSGQEEIAEEATEESDSEAKGISVDELEEQRSEKEVTQQEDREKFWNSFEEDIEMKEVDFGSYEIYETTATRMVERIENKDTFILFITTADNEGKEKEKEIFTKIGYEVVPDYPMYYVEEEYSYDSYAEEMNSIEPLIPYLTVDEDDEDFFASPYHYGIYEFVDGELEVYDTNIQVYDPEQMNEAENETIESNIEQAMRLVVGNLPSAYNFETILRGKGELESFLKDNSDCVIYVGRDSCPYCPQLRREVMGLIDHCEWNVPVAYFCAQHYAIAKLEYGASSQEYSDAQVDWDAIKSLLTIDYIPAVIVYRDGEVAHIYDTSYVGESFYNALVEDGSIKGYKPGKEVDWTLKYSEGNPKNDEVESSETVGEK